MLVSPCPSLHVTPQQPPAPQPCRRSKIKCSNEIPCAHCISRGIEHSCVPCGNPGKVQVPRPSSNGPLSGQVDDSLFLLLPTMEFRWSEDDISGFLRGLPPLIQTQVEARYGPVGVVVPCPAPGCNEVLTLPLPCR